MTRRALVVGAAGPVGAACVRALRALGWDVVATARDPARATAAVAAGAQVAQADLTAPETIAAAAPGCAAAVLTPLLSLSVNAIAPLQAAGVARVAALSSHNVAIDPKAPVYAALAAAETRLRAAFPACLIVRPTMIYGHPALAGMAGLVRLARRAPVLPVPGAGGALQQPIFFEDLARLLVAGVYEDGLIGRTISIGGPETLPLRALYAAAARAAGRSGQTVPIPLPLLRLAGGLAGPRFPLSAAQLARADKDKAAGPPPPDLPAGLAPATPLDVGLKRLADALA